MFASTRSNHRMLAAAIAANLLFAVVIGIGLTVRPANAGMLLPSQPASSSALPGAGPGTTRTVVLGGDGTTPSGTGGAGVQGTGTGGRGSSGAAEQGPPPAGSAAAAAATLAATGRGTASSVGVTRPAPRTEPSKAALQGAIRELDARTNYFRPTEKQIREFSGEVCTAFDQGYSYAEVKAGVLDSAKRAPYLGVSSADADYSVRSAVQLFCPGYAPLLP